MTDRTAPDATTADPGGVPILPTGSGVADLEVAYEQMRLAEGAPADPASSRELDPSPAEDVAESEAHPS